MCYYRMLIGAVGKDVVFDDGIKILNPSRVFLGDHVGFNVNCYVSAGPHASTNIGNYVRVGPMVTIEAVNHRFDRIGIPIYHQGYTEAQIDIDDDVWIGAGSVILPGVHIGAGAIIGAGAVVTHDIPAYSVAVGVPAEVKWSRLSTTPPAVVDRAPEKNTRGSEA